VNIPLFEDSTVQSKIYFMLKFRGNIGLESLQKMMPEHASSSVYSALRFMIIHDIVVYGSDNNYRLTKPQEEKA